LPIHLEAKSAAVHLFALRDQLRDGFLRRGWHGYGLARLSRRRGHLMISLGRYDIKFPARMCPLNRDAQLEL
jgi:hypothetical protein